MEERVQEKRYQGIVDYTKHMPFYWLNFSIVGSSSLAEWNGGRLISGDQLFCTWLKKYLHDLTGHIFSPCIKLKLLLPLLYSSTVISLFKQLYFSYPKTPSFIPGRRCLENHQFFSVTGVQCSNLNFSRMVTNINELLSNHENLVF